MLQCLFICVLTFEILLRVINGPSVTDTCFIELVLITLMAHSLSFILLPGALPMRF